MSIVEILNDNKEWQNIIKHIENSLEIQVDKNMLYNVLSQYQNQNLDEDKIMNFIYDAIFATGDIPDQHVLEDFIDELELAGILLPLSLDVNLPHQIYTINLFEQKTNDNKINVKFKFGDLNKQEIFKENLMKLFVLM